MKSYLPPILALLLWPLSAPDAQQAGTSASGTDPAAAFVVSNLEYITLHELAHVLIEDLDIPIIGPEESAADYIATATLIRPDEFSENRARRAREFLLTTANGLATSWEFTLESGQEINYWDSHFLTIQRFYQMVCLIFGSDPETFAALPTRVGMPEARASRCPREYARAASSLRWLTDNFGRKPDDPDGAPVEIVYERPPTIASAAVLAAIRESRVLENTVARLHERFTIREPFDIALRRCGEQQAAWQPEKREILVCYELLDLYYLLGRTQRSLRRREILEPPN
ncbi:MAG TPA: DUF4344 domain-containing metallopeptidase [Gammaproteobacteria bacterium]